MSSVGSKGVIIQDALGGDAVTVTDGRMDVNAAITISSSTIDIGDVEIKGYGEVAHSTMNVTDSAVALPTAACKHADIMATIANTGVVFIGAAGVDATTGIALYPGDVYSVNITTLQSLYAMSTVSGDDLNIVVYY